MGVAQGGKGFSTCPNYGVKVFKYGQSCYKAGPSLILKQVFQNGTVLETNNEPFSSYPKTQRTPHAPYTFEILCQSIFEGQILFSFEYSGTGARYSRQHNSLINPSTRS
jgi:hypothetical protein